jgi:hypothetical protein
MTDKQGFLTMSRVPPILPPRDQIADDTPLRLDVAAALAYPDGSMTASGLRKEAGRGRLEIERTAGKDYTTLAAIAEMRKLCRQNLKDRACGSAKQDATSAAAQHTEPFGSSSTESIKRAQAAAATIVQELKSSSRHTSTASTRRQRPRRAPVIPIKSLSPTS